MTESGKIEMYDVIWENSGELEQGISASEIISEHEQTHEHAATDDSDRKKK